MARKCRRTTTRRGAWEVREKLTGLLKRSCRHRIWRMAGQSSLTDSSHSLTNWPTPRWALIGRSIEVILVERTCRDMKGPCVEANRRRRSTEDVFTWIWCSQPVGIGQMDLQGEYVAFQQHNDRKIASKFGNKTIQNGPDPWSGQISYQKINIIFQMAKRPFLLHLQDRDIKYRWWRDFFLFICKDCRAVLAARGALWTPDGRWAKKPVEVGGDGGA